MDADHRKYMKMAIEQARKQVKKYGMEADAARPNPLVGCVIVTADGLEMAGFRGEENPGDHAEFTVMEKKLDESVQLAGATVYTTLEPCTDRTPPKVSCAERLIQRKVSRVFIGYYDPDARGRGYHKLEQANIEVQNFDPDLVAQIVELNRHFIASRTRLTLHSPAEMPIIPTGDPSDKRTDDSLLFPKKWVATNHSVARLAWEPLPRDGSEWTKVIRLLSSHYGHLIKSVREIEKPSHGEGSDVYRIADKDVAQPTILLKVFRKLRNDSELEALSKIQRGIKEAEVFNDYSSYVAPHSTIDGSDWTPPFENSQSQAMAYPFLDGAKDGSLYHFSGASLKELSSIGQTLGKLNSHLILKNVVPIAPLFFRWCPSLWTRIIGKLQESTPQNRSHYLARSELPFIEKIAKEVAGLERPDRRPTTLNDFHPHNAFLCKGECVLIVDYEAIREDWPEEATVALAMHRFCREYVRLRESAAQAQRMSIIASARDAFFAGYGLERPDASEAIRSKGLLWAKAVNFAKLMNNIGYELGEVTDQAGRTEIQHYREIIKFVSYLQELNDFSVDSDNGGVSI